jgi:EmrB/QacA subfamily drug resistance transporter
LSAQGPSGGTDPDLSCGARWGILIAIGVGAFMSALDGSAVNSVLPVIRKAFGCEVATIQWTVTIYLLVVSALLLSFGRLGDLRGHKRMYLSGFAIFVASSAVCGLSRSVAMLITMRGIQALGAALLFANSPAILTANFPASERGRALGLLATMTYLGLTAGPSLGGFLSDRLSWRAIFYVNIPIGGLAMFLSAVRIPVDRPEKWTGRFDRFGAVLFTVGLTMLLLALNQAHEWGWGSPAVIGLLAGSVAILVFFILTEMRVDSPMCDLTLFQSRTFAAATVSAGLNYVSLFSVTFVLPFYLIQGRGFSPSHAGLVLTAQPIVMAITAPLSGALSDRIGARLPGTIGMAVLALGLVLLSRIGPESSTALVVGSLAVVGLGTGIFISPNSSALLGAAPRTRQGIASGILATARNVGMVLGVGMSGAIFTTILSRGGGRDAIYAAVRMSFLAGATVAALGAVVSATRGKGEA